MSPAHLTGNSFYPFLISSILFFKFTSLLLYLNFSIIFPIFLCIIYSVFLVLTWFKDVCLESLSGHHNFFVQDGIKLSFILFVFGEVMFFFSLFWVFFDSSLNPIFTMGGIWPPFMLFCPNYLGIPLLGTLVLLSSGVSLTWFHFSFVTGHSSNISYLITLFLSLLFLFLQFYEYSNCFFSISDGVYGSVFFFSTGFHGFHVFLGFFFLLYCFFRLNNNSISFSHHLGLECAILYWHFVDVVWLFLYIFVYSWGFFDLILNL